MLHAVILAGGSGVRFWPVSQKDRPKQFLPLASDRTLLQETVDRLTVDRLETLIPVSQVRVATRESFASTVLEQIPELQRGQLLLEPAPRDTAPCLAVAAAEIARMDPEAILVVLPSDHLVEDVAAFQKAIRTAHAAVEADPERMILIGAVPTSPATGYGYIEAGSTIPLPACSTESSFTLHEVTSFREKPDLQTAQQYLETGRFLWSCGMFVWKARTFLKVLAASAPDLTSVLDELATFDPVQEAAQWNTTFLKFRPISVDYAVLEHAPKLGVIRASFGWDDLGSWEAMARHRTKDAHGNVVCGNAFSQETRDCIIYSEGNHLITTLGIDDLVVVHTPSATLIARRGDEAALKSLVSEIEKRKS